ncbi:MAG: murein biosynthesis integral membrane protein MurJ [bacterium]
MINLRKQTIIQATFLLTLVSLIGKGLGFIREMSIASVFGAKTITDAYIVAQVLPATLAGLVGGALTTVFIPVFLEQKEKYGEKEAWRAANTVISVGCIYLLIATLLALILTYPFIELIAPGFSQEKRDLAVLITRMMMPGLILYGLLGLFTGLLQSYKHFFIPSIGGLLFNIFIIGFVLVFGKRFPAGSLVTGNILGVLSQVIIALWYLKRSMPYLEWHIDYRHPAVKQTFYLMIPILVGTSAGYINLIVDRIFASALPEGSISALNFAARVRDLPVSLFASSIATAVYPTTSELVANNDIHRIRDLLIKTLSFTWLIIIPAEVGLFILDKEIIRLLFQRGAFDLTATYLTAGALRYYSIGIFALASSPIVARTFYSFQDTVTPVVISFISIGLNIALNALLVRSMLHEGLALATSISGIFAFILLVFLLRKKMKSIGGKFLLLEFSKITLASLVMGYVVRSLNLIIAKPNTNLIYEILSIMLLISVGVLVYILSILLLKVRSGIQLKEFIERRIKPKK